MPQSVNTFTELNSDSHPVNTSNKVMTDAVNATLTTRGENQLILQNMEGNETITGLTDGFQALGFSVYNDISYIVSGKFADDGTFIEGEIGTYPSPDWTGFLGGAPDPDLYLPLKNEYQPLRNFSTSEIDFVLDKDVSYFEPFRTSFLNFPAGKLIEVKTQPSYDGSVNIIFTDDYNPIRLVNSRFKLSENGKLAAIADRRQTKDTNTYSNKRFGSCKLLKQSDIIPDLTFMGVENGGSHNGGGYRFYFKYIDSDGSLTDIIEESRLVTMAYDDHGADMNENTGKLVKFRLANLDKKFSGIKVYFSHASGETDTTTSIYEITNIYDLDDDYEIDITIYGNEDLNLIERGKLNLDYSSIDTAKTIEQYNSQLLIGNITNKTESFEELRLITQRLQIEEDSTTLEIKELGSGYADPDNVYFKLGVWAGETYELGVVYVLKNGRGNTPVLPIRGGDNLKGTFSYTGTDPILTSDGYVEGSTENRLGAYRTFEDRVLLSGDNNTTEIRYLKVNIDSIKNDEYVRENTNGFFFVRKERKRDCIVQGYLTNTVKEPVNQKNATIGYLGTGTPNKDWFEDRDHIQDIREGSGKFNSSSVAQKVFPAPGRIWESTIKTTSTLDKAGAPLSMQGKVNPNPQFVTNSEGDHIDMFYAFYAPDALADAPIMASTFNGAGKGIMIHDNPVEAWQQFSGIELVDYVEDREVFKLGYSIDSFGTIGEDDYGMEFYGDIYAIAADGYYVSVKAPVRVTYQRKNIDNEPVSLITTAYFNISPGGYISNPAYACKTVMADINMNDAQITNAEVGNPRDAILGASMVTFDIHLANLTVVDEAGTEYIFQAAVDGTHSKSLIGHFILSEELMVHIRDIGITNNSSEPIKDLQIKNNAWHPRLLIDPALIGGSSRQNYMQYIGAYQDSYGGDQFSAISDRSLYYVANIYSDINLLDQPYTNGYPETGRRDAKMFAVNNNRFADYIGLRMTLFDPGLASSLRNDDLNVFNYNTEVFESSLASGAGSFLWRNGYGLTGIDLQDYNYNLQFRGVRLGVVAKIYDDPDGVMSSENWKSKYSNTSFTEGYFAVTKRYSWDTLPLDGVVEIFDGDCYPAYSYKRVLYGLGIPSNPAAIDPDLYEDRNQETGLSPKGFVFPMVTENNYNVALRTFDVHSETEKALYGKPRTFFPIDSANAMRATRQPESYGYNHGYDYDYSDRNYVSLNERAPTLSINYGNRIMVSEVNVDGDFKNGYVDFSGLNFRDYNSQLGELTKIISHNNQVYCVFESGVGILPINEKTMVTDQGTSQVFIDDAQVLAQKMQILSSEYGSNQQFSIIKTDMGVYGVDLNKNKIWRVISGRFEIISDFAVQAILNVYKDRLVSNNLNNVIITNYDRERNNVVFSYLSEYNGKYSTDLYRLVEAPAVVEDIACPIDMKSKVSTDGSIYVESTSGQLISDYCCSSMGGVWSNVEGETSLVCVIEQGTLGGGSGTTPAPGQGGGGLGNLGRGSLGTGSDNTPKTLFTVGVNGRLYTTNEDGELVLVGNQDSRQNLIPELWKKNDYGSLYYNETLSKWISRLSWNPLFMFNLESNLFSFNALADSEKLWKHFSTSVPYCNFYGRQDKFIFEFMLVENSSVQKILDNLMLISNRSFPGRITYGLIEDDVDYESFASINNGYVQLNKQRHEPPASVGWLITTTVFGASSYCLVDGMSKEETERIAGGYILFGGVFYIIGSSYENAGLFYNEILDQNGISIPGGLPIGWTFNKIEFGIIKQNMEYIEDHLYIEVGHDETKSRIRDKAIRIRVMYEGYDFTVVQAIISKFIYSFN